MSSQLQFAELFRAETPGAVEVIHLNAASAALPSRSVTDTVVGHLRREAQVGLQRAASEVGESLEAVRASAAALLGCKLRNVAFGPSAGRLWAMAFTSRPIPPRSKVLVARSEWVSNVLNLLRLQQTGALQIQIMPVDERNGVIDVQRTAELIDERTFAICLPTISSGNGTVQAVEAVSALPRPAGCLLFVDATQAIGQRTTTLGQTGADVLVTPGRKWLRGPRGEALMALSDKALAILGDPPLLDHAGSPWTEGYAYRMRDDAQRFESYDFSVAGRLGLGAAIDLALRHGVQRIRSVIRSRLRFLHRGLSALPGIRIFEDIDADPSFLTFAADTLPPEELNERLADAGVMAATVDLGYARLDFEARGLSAVNRVSPHAYTSEADLDRFLEVIGTSARVRA